MVKNELYICKEWHIQPSEIEKRPYYEYEWILEYINEDHKEQEKRSQEEQKEYESMRKGMPNMNSMMKGYQQPTLPKVSLPKFG